MIRKNVGYVPLFLEDVSVNPSIGLLNHWKAQSRRTEDGLALKRVNELIRFGD
jgi:hypothetical protein